MLDYVSPEVRRARAPILLVRIVCLVGVVGNAGGMFVASTLRHVPPGSKIWPFNEGAKIGMIAFVTLAIGLPLGIRGLIRGWGWPWLRAGAALGVVPSLTPMFTSSWVMNWIIARNGLILVD
jgi:hypothetical protein